MKIKTPKTKNDKIKQKPPKTLTKLSLFCVGQLLGSMGSALECGCNTLTLHWRKLISPLLEGISCKLLLG